MARKYCPGCSEKELIIRVLRDAVSLGRGGGVGAVYRGVSDYADSLVDDPRLRPRRASRRISPMDDVIAKPRQKVKRKVSGYQKEFGKQLKKLKKNHPRTKVSRLMKRAHAATKRVRK
jgi:hypothetical protein|tara:strand:- start:1095 stop:1448 length:354 start_codon:yes stop_codon:yes gene_type:complete